MLFVYWSTVMPKDPDPSLDVPHQGGAAEATARTRRGTREEEAIVSQKNENVQTWVEYLVREGKPVPHVWENGPVNITPRAVGQ